MNPNREVWFWFEANEAFGSGTYVEGFLVKRGMLQIYSLSVLRMAERIVQIEANPPIEAVISNLCDVVDGSENVRTTVRNTSEVGIRRAEEVEISSLGNLVEFIQVLWVILFELAGSITIVIT